MNRNETSRLQFTDAERGDPRLRKHIRRADKAADKLEKAQASIPKQKKRIKSSLRKPGYGWRHILIVSESCGLTGKPPGPQ